MFFAASAPEKPVDALPTHPLSSASKWVTGSSGMSLRAPSVGVGAMAGRSSILPRSASSPLLTARGVSRPVDPSSVVDGALPMGSMNALSSPSRAADGAGTSAYPERHLVSNYPPPALTDPPTSERLITPYWHHQL